MNAAVFIILLVVGVAGFGAWVLFRAAKRKFQQFWRTHERVDQVHLLHKGLEQEGFFAASDKAGQLKVLENSYLSKLATELTRDGILQEYARTEKLTITNNTNPGVRYGWLLRSDGHCLGFELKS